jgi:hypothetical protein
MVIISCDICKKKMDNPITGRTFFYIANHSICEPCKDSLEYSLKPTIRSKDPFTMEWYNKFLRDNLDKAAHKGRA